jgi:hypothetical protein
VTAAGSPYVVPEGVDLTVYAVANAGYYIAEQRRRRVDVPRHQTV